MTACVAAPGRYTLVASDARFHWTAGPTDGAGRLIRTRSGLAVAATGHVTTFTAALTALSAAPVASIEAAAALIARVSARVAAGRVLAGDPSRTAFLLSLGGTIAAVWADGTIAAQGNVGGIVSTPPGLTDEQSQDARRRMKAASELPLHDCIRAVARVFADTATLTDAMSSTVEFITGDGFLRGDARELAQLGDAEMDARFTDGLPTVATLYASLAEQRRLLRRAS